MARTIIPGPDNPVHDASSTVKGITKLSTNPSTATNPIALNAEEVTATPTASKVARADGSGLLDSWISKAAQAVFGRTRLSVAPASSSTPIAVGDNDSRVPQVGTRVGQVPRWDGAGYVPFQRPWSSEEAPPSANANDTEFAYPTITPYSPAAWQPSTHYDVGTPVLNGSNGPYVCITAGTSASSGGPTGTGTDITDGTGGTAVHWKYFGAPAWSSGAGSYSQGAQVTNGGNLYVCVNPGSSSTGPTGTGNNISDGGVARWSYAGSPTNPLLPALWARGTFYSLNALVCSGTNIYLCTSPGTSSSNTSNFGPQSGGTGTGIIDGGATWNYVGPQTGTIGGFSIAVVYNGSATPQNLLPATNPIHTAMTLGTRLNPTTTPTWPSWNYDTVNRPGRMRFQFGLPNGSSPTAAFIQLYRSQTLDNTCTMLLVCGSSGRNSTQSNNDGMIQLVATESLGAGAIGSLRAIIDLNTSSSNYVQALTETTGANGPSTTSNNTIGPVDTIGLMRSTNTWWGVWGNDSTKQWSYTPTMSSTGSHNQVVIRLNPQTSTTPGVVIFDLGSFRYFPACVSY